MKRIALALLLAFVAFGGATTMAWADGDMSDVKVESAGRRGGRDARRALRTAPLAVNQRPVRPGLEGGRYKPLDDADIVRIHQAALDVHAKVPRMAQNQETYGPWLVNRKATRCIAD